MAQHDMDIANASGASVRQDINLALAALVSSNAGASAPSTTFANMLWADTGNSLLKMRNQANSDWITIGDLDTAFLGLLSAGSLPAGMCVQIQSTQTGAVATGTTVIPLDDSIPQNTEGDEYMSLSITPSDASNILIIDVVCHLLHSSSGVGLIAALFQDSTTAALAASAAPRDANGTLQAIVFRHKMVAGTASSTTFKVRGGGSGAGTTTFNGISGSRLFGGVLASSITISEYTV